MLAASTVAFILAALIAALVLPGTSNAATLPEDTDRPNIDYAAMFKAFLDMGNAIFGDWVPEKVLENYVGPLSVGGRSVA